ncbi:NAD kinase [Undibacterium macrobrachii]|jgi:NAD+ kinase|uniref:NAD kinase n=1 Tax=Undibacterium macrobrachii TaxID=1119058 RepID=A0ABQ2X827_9BURK|nr:NAD kinase [Undibacterium macrobrachii]GGX03765.1 NAD kinase [Undibacterium macrobrachii]
MTTISKTIALIGKYNALGMGESLNELANSLADAGHVVVFDTDSAQNLALNNFPALSVADIGRSADVAIVLGGDGTMLGIARQLAPYDVPLIGINQGRLGFITDIPRDQMISVVAHILSGKHIAEERRMLEAIVVRDGEQIFSGVAFNDIVLSRGAGSGMIELRVEVDQHFMYNQRSDGLIVSTPTGSTAYALSAGGPLLHPSLGGIAMVPIAPHALSNRPIVLPDTSVISVEIVAGRDASVNFDMQSFANLNHKDKIIIKRSTHHITFWHPEDWNYYHTLREKLHWNEYPSVEGALN